MKNQTVIGVFDNRKKAQEAYENLLAKGFNRTQVDLSADYNEMGAQKSDRTHHEHEGGIAGFFESLFGTDDDTRNYKEVARRGTVVTVHTESLEKAKLAQSILDSHGAVDVDDHARRFASGTDADISKGKESISVIEEELQVGKRAEETGKIRIRSRIVEVPVEEHLRLRSEHITVERNPVDRKATKADMEGFKEEVIEMTEHTEKAVVNKEARVVEEINVRKDVEEHDETIREKVKKTEVDIDETGKGRHHEGANRNRT